MKTYGCSSHYLVVVVAKLGNRRRKRVELVHLGSKLLDLKLLFIQTLVSLVPLLTE